MVNESCLINLLICYFRLSDAPINSTYAHSAYIRREAQQEYLDDKQSRRWIWRIRPGCTEEETQSSLFGTLCTTVSSSV